MDTPVIIAIGVAALLVIALLMVLSRRKAAKSKEIRRGQAEEHRNLAQVAQLEADHRAAEAEERAARARKAQLAAAPQALDAERAREEAANLHDKADRLDPDKGRRR